MPRLKLGQIPRAPRQVTATPADFGAGEAQALQTAGQALGATGQLVDSVSQARARNAANEYSAELGLGVERITADINDLENWETRFNELESSLADKHSSKAFIDEGTFKQQASLRALERRTALENQLNARLVDAGREAFQGNLTAYEEEFQAGILENDPVKQELAMAKIAKETFSAAQENLIYEESVVERVKESRGRAVTAAIQGMMFDEPARAREVLNQHADDLGETRTAVLQDKVARAYRAKVRRDTTERSARLSLEATQRRQAQDETFERMLDLARTDEQGITSDQLDDAMATEHGLRSDQLLKLNGIVAGGGRLQSTAINPHLYKEALKRIAYPESYNDQPFSSWAIGSVGNGMTLETARQLISDNDDARFGGYARALSKAIESATLIRKPAQIKAATSAALGFQRWRTQNPNATQQEVDEEFERITDSFNTLGIDTTHVIPAVMPDFPKDPVTGTTRFSEALGVLQTRTMLDPDNPDYLTDREVAGIIKTLQREAKGAKLEFNLDFDAMQRSLEDGTFTDFEVTR